MLQTTIADSLATLRNSGAYGRVENLGLLEIYGVDAQRFLQAQTTNDVLKLEHCASQLSCILDRKAHVQSYFTLYRRHDSYRIIGELDQITVLLSHFDAFIFADKVEVVDVTSGGVFITVQGPKALNCIRQGLHSSGQTEALEHDLCDVKLWGVSCHVFKKSLTGVEGYLVRVPVASADAVLEKLESVCRSEGMIELTKELKKTARIESGLPLFGVDFSNDNFLPETGLEDRAVSYTKGCFLGQEVLARVRSQGAPTRGLVGIIFSPGQRWTFPLNTRLTINSEEIACLKSNCYSPTLDTTIALAFVKRDYRVPDKTYTAQIEGQDYTVTVKLLPFIQPQNAQEKARALYEKALTQFVREADDGTSESVAMLREALALDAKLEDAYEALGVILSKHGELDEAIALMKKLVELNPDSVMAHTNLSVFYVDKGMKEAAEEEKAISTSIRMRQVLQQSNQAEKEKQDKEASRLEALERMEMFTQVLAIDQDDLLANFGVGDCHVALAQFEQAIPYLQKAIEIKPSHTVAYVSLGQAYQGLGQNDQAACAYQKGIEVAAKRGDMTPLQDMRRRLAQLQDSSKKDS